MSYGIFKSEAKKLSKLHKDYDDNEKKFDTLNHQKKAFYEIIGQNQSKNTALGILCLFALIFDFYVNSSTLFWLPIMLSTKTPVFVFAIIFSVFDAVIASLQAGAFVNTKIAKDQQKKIWRPFLWALGGLKMILFIVFTQVVTIDGNNGTLIVTLLQLLFIGLVYSFLDYGGEGIYYLLKWSIFKFKEVIWYVKPSNIEHKGLRIYLSVQSKCPSYNLNYQDFLTNFNLPGKFK